MRDASSGPLAKFDGHALNAAIHTNQHNSTNLNAQLGSNVPAQNSDQLLVKQDSVAKQNSILRTSSYLKQATGITRWQSRRLFWSAVDAKQAQPELSIACSNTRLAIYHWWQTVKAVARRHPSIFIAPLLLGCACLAGGIIGVALSAQKVEQDARDDARVVAGQAAAALAVLLDGGAGQPAVALATLAAEQPAAVALLGALPQLAQRLLQQAPNGAVRQLLLAPFGVVAAVIAPAPAPNGSLILTAPGATAGPAGAAVGSSLLTDPASRPAVLRAIRSQMPATSGPTLQAAGAAVGSGAEVILTTHHPVYVTGVGADEAWGNSGGPISAADCVGLCYLTENRTKLWGFSSAAVSLTALARASPSGFDGLADMGYSYRLTMPLTGEPDPRVLAASSPAPPAGASGKTTVSVLVPLSGVEPNALPVLTLHHSEGWRPAWEGPLYAVVVLASLALACLLFAVLLNHWRHTAMLRAMLPKKVLAVLNTGSHFYQHFDCVTVLYADVVRYTAAKQQDGGGGLPPVEVVKLLNDVHSMYEAIIEKYGLVRIRRSGESFMCVGGCPTPDDPVAVAVRVASCARDMVLATARYTSASGLSVQLRVGLHSGPVVAAVVGTKMPRFSLFGDVVDVAYYLEATSTAMAVHVSDRTSQLLVVADDPSLQLLPRGRMEIIGQGSMATTWLKIEGMPDPSVAVAAAAAAAGPADGEEDQLVSQPDGAAVVRDLGAGSSRRGGGGASATAAGDLLSNGRLPPEGSCGGAGADAHADVLLANQHVVTPGSVNGSSDDYEEEDSSSEGGGSGDGDGGGGGGGGLR